MTDVALRPMQSSDIPYVLEIERSVFTTPWTEDMFLHELQSVFNSQPVVAVCDKRLIGYALAWFFDDDVHLVNIAVEKAHQARGVGTLLVTDIIEKARKGGQTLITLEVRASNAGAQGFYRNFHFRTVGVRKGYYTDNREDALLMVLDLASDGAQGQREDD